MVRPPLQHLAWLLQAFLLLSPPSHASAADAALDLAGRAGLALDAGDREGASRLIAAHAGTRGPGCDPACRGEAALAAARARLAYFEGRFADSVMHAADALAELRRLPAAGWPDALATLERLADVAVLAGEWELAGQALALYAERSPADDTHAARVAVGRLVLAVQRGELRQAAASLAQVEAGALPEGRSRARLLIARAVLSYFRADYAAARDDSLAAVALIEGADWNDAAAVAEALSVAGVAENSAGRLEAAATLHRRCLAVRERIFVPDHPLIAEASTNLGVVMHDIGRYDLAEALFSRSLAISEAHFGPDHYDVASDLHNLASVYRSMGAPRRALPMLERAAAINRASLGMAHYRTAIVYQGLGLAYLELDEYERAYASFEQSLAVHRAANPESRSIPILEHSMATAAVELGEHREARALIGRVLPVYLVQYGPYHRHVAAAHRELGRALVGLGDLAAADGELLQSVEIAAVVNAPEVEWRSLMALAEQERRLMRPAGAVFFGKLALDVLQRLRSSQGSLDQALRSAFARQRADSYRRIAGWLVELGRLTEASRVYAMLKHEEYYDFTRRQGGDVAEVPFTRFESEQRSALAVAVAGGPSGDAGERAARYGAELQRVRTLFAELPAEAATADAGAAAPAALPQRGHAMLEYIVDAGATTVIVSGPGGPSSHRIAVPRAELRRRVFELLEASRDPAGDPLPAARGLHETLFAPLEQGLREAGAASLWLRLDDVLRYVPFAVLHDGRRYLGERYAVAMVGGVQRPPRPDVRVAAFATTQAVRGYAALPGAAAEVEGIVRRGGADRDGVFPGRIWSDASFDRAALRAALGGDYTALHIASHFEFWPGSEADSFLLLGDGERLSLQELRTGGYPLAGVDLITMSGCDTALSIVDADGREIDGFATLAADRGAASIVASLWAVEDAATAELMRRFYRRLARGDSPPRALQAAQRRLMARHPFYWAPFVAWASPPP